MEASAELLAGLGSSLVVRVQQKESERSLNDDSCTLWHKSFSFGPVAGGSKFSISHKTESIYLRRSGLCLLLQRCEGGGGDRSGGRKQGKAPSPITVLFELHADASVANACR